MEVEINEAKRRSADTFEKLAFIFGIISITGAFCCIPFVFSGLSLIFAMLSKGASMKMSEKAKTGAVCSAIGLVVSTVTIVALVVFSLSTTKKELENNPDFVDEMREQYEQMYDSMGMDMPESMESYLDTLDDMFGK